MRERDVPHAADAVLVLPDDRRRRVDVDAGHRPRCRRSTPAPRVIGPKSQSAVDELVPAVVEHEDAAAALHLLELPLVAAHRHVPAAAAAADHLQVVAADVAELAGLDDVALSFRSGS